MAASDPKQALGSSAELDRRGDVLGQIQKRILAVSIVLIVLVNGWYALGIRFFSNSFQHEVGPADVSVYVPTQHSVVTKVEAIGGHAFVDTGQRVAVFLRNDYCGKESEFGPSRSTLLIVVTAYLMWLLVGKLIPGEDSRRRRP